jgi:acetyltransferase-like isoleucine patch superfamily enzyme
MTSKETGLNPKVTCPNCGVSYEAMLVVKNQIVDSSSTIFPTSKIVSKEMEIGKKCLIGDFAFVAARKLIMMDGSQISPHAIIGGGGNVTLSKYSVVGFGAKLFPATDQTSAEFMCEAAPPEKRDVIRGSITLGEGVYIGSGAVICVSKKCPNIEIGDNTVVGSLSYIDESLPANIVIHPKIQYTIKKRRMK